MGDGKNGNGTEGLSRRAWLGGAALVLGGGTAALTATSAAAKTPQAAAKYQDNPKDGKKCSECAQFQAPNACTVVDGKISPEGWCMLYVKKG